MMRREGRLVAGVLSVLCCVVLLLVCVQAGQAADVDELRNDRLLGVSTLGEVAAPQLSADGATTTWKAIVSDPGGRLTLAEGVLTVKSLPSGFDYEEAVVTLTLTADSISTDVDIRLVVYDPLYHTLIDVPNASMEAMEGTVPVDWKGTVTNSDSVYMQASGTYSRTGTSSVRVVDTSTGAGIGARSNYSSVTVKRGWDYVASIWARGTASASAANRNGASMYLEFYNTTGTRQSYVTDDGVAINTDGWTQLTARGTANGVRASVMGYSYAATTGDMYFDDALLWEITAAGILAEIDELIVAGADADTLYARLGNGAVSISARDERNKQAYLTYLADLRTNKGSALTQQELADGVVAANAAVVAADQALVEQMAGEVPDTQSLSALGEIALPTVSDSTVALAWTAVTGDANGRIRMTEVGPVLDSQPDYGSSAETCVMTLTISKGDASTTVNVTTTVQPYTKSMSQLIEASQSLDISTYLNGQDPSYVTSSLASLPSKVRLGVLDYVWVSWEAVNTNTYRSTGIMSDAGKVARGPYDTMDTAVVLRATLTKSSDTYTREYHLIVPSLGADDARTLITNNAGFESAAPSDPTAAPDGWLKHTKWADGANEVESTYTGVDGQVCYTGSQSLRITVDETMAAMYAKDNRRTISVQNEHILTAREGHIYSLQAMVLTRSQNTNPSVTLRFLDNEGVVLSEVTRNYTAVSSGMWNTWKNLTATAIAPAGTVMVAAELDGGSQVGVSWFDDVRLREMPLVPNGSFDLDSVGWTTQGTVTDGKLVLGSGVTAESVSRLANRGVTYFLSLDAEGSGTAALRFLDSSGAALAEYSKDVATGTNALYAYAPENTKSMQVVLTGGSLTADNVKITRAPTGTGVADGGFENSAAGIGTPWELSNAAVGAATGRSGAGLTVSDGGTARSAIIPVIDGKTYTFTADVKGTDGVMSIELYNNTDAVNPDKVVTVNSAGSSWNTITYTFDQLPEVIGGGAIEHAYARVVLSGQAVFDNVAAYSITKSLSNASVENINNTLYGSFPYNWHTYGPAAGFVANQQGQATEGIKSLGVELFGLGEGGVRSSMVHAQAGQAYQATAQVMGTGAALSMEFWSEAFELLSSQTSAISSDSWQTSELTAAAPEGTAYVSLSVGGSGTGLAYVDQASIVPVVRTIGTNVQLFLDDWLVGDRTNVTRTFQPGQKLDQMISGGWYGNVVWNPDKELYEMWHQASKPASYSLLYRTSADGVTWSEPQTCSSANIPNTHTMPSPTVFLDLKESDAAKRYKLVCYNMGEGGYGLHTSPDGINWTRYGTILPGADVITVAYDQVNEEYVATYKMSQSGTLTKRTHSIAVSKDLINWSEGVRMYNVATPLDMAGGAYFRADGYGTSMYPLGDSYIGFNWRFLINENDGYSGKMDVPLLFSRDLTEDWQRMYDDSGELVIAIPRGQEGEWDDAQTYAHSYPIQMGDETWWYYHGWTGDHGVVDVPKTAGVSAVKWRRNGFASLDFGTGGTMTTQQFVLAGQILRLNAKGSLTVELLDQAGNVAATAAFEGDSVDQALEWDQSVAAHIGQPVSLRFTGSDAQLYSLQLESVITVIQGPNGTVEVTPASGAAGTQVTVTATPAAGYRCLHILVDGQPISGNTFAMTAEHTVSAVFRPEDELFYNDMESYTVDSEIPVAEGNKFANGRFDNLNGGSYTRLIRQDGRDNRYLEMTASNLADSTGRARFWIETGSTFQGDYAVRWRLNVTSEEFYVNDGILPYVTGPDSKAVTLRTRGVDSDTIKVYFAGSAYDSSLLQNGDSKSALNLRDAQGDLMMLDKNAWYTYELLVDSQNKLVTANLYSAEGALLGTRSLPGCTMAETAVRMDHFGPEDYTTVDTTVAYLDDVTVSQYVPVAHTITTGAATNGVIRVDKTSAVQGQTVTVTATPDDGYKLDAIFVNGQAITGNVFTMPSCDVTVSARFLLQGVLFHDEMDYALGGDIYTLAPEQYTTTSAAQGNAYYITGAGAGNSGVAVVADPTGADNTCLEVTVENNTTSAKRYILVTEPAVSGDYVLEFDYMPTKAASNSGSGFLDVYIADGKNNIARLNFKKDANQCLFYGDSISDPLKSPTDSSSNYVFKDNTWYSVRITVAADGYVMELWEKGREATTKSTTSTGSTVTANTTTHVEFCFGPYNASQLTSMDAPIVNYIDNITITQLRPVQVTQPEQGGTVRVSASNAMVGQTVSVEAVAQPGCTLEEILVNEKAISGTSFVMPDRSVTVTAVFDTTGQLFYDDMESYTAGEAIPEGTEEKWVGEFGKLVGGTYTRLVRQDDEGNRYLEMTATNTASSTGVSRFWLDTNRTFTGSYIVRWSVVKASDPYYVLDSKLPSVLGPDGKMLNLRIRDYGEDTNVAFAGSSFASALQVTGDSSSSLFLRDSAGAKLMLDQDTQYTMELVVDSAVGSVTGRVYDANGQLISARTLTGCTLAESAFRLDHFACSPKTTLNTTTTKVDNVGVYERYVITAAATENGSVSLSRTDGAVGDVVTVTAVPAEGYVLKEITVDGTAISGSSFTIDGNHTVSAVFGSMAGVVEAQNIAAGGNYLLADDVTLSGTATLTGELTIDLGGYTITGLSGLSGTVSIKDTSAGQTGKVSGAIPAGAVIYGGSFDSAPAVTQLATDDAYIIEKTGSAYRVSPGLVHRNSIIDFRSSLALQLQLVGDNDETVDDSYTVTAKIGDDTVSAVITSITPTDTETPIPVVSINGIPARRMRDTVSVSVEKGGVVYYTGNVSIYETAAGWYTDEDSGIDEAMLADLLNYGDEAHKALDDPEYTYEALTGGTSETPEWSAVGSMPDAYKDLVDFTLSLKNKVALNVYINAANAQVPQVSFNDETYEYQKEGGWYSVEQVPHRDGYITRITFDNIDVGDAKKAVSFTVKLSETESFDMTCGIPDYVAAALANTQHTQKAVIESLQKYVDSVIRVLGGNS